MRKRIEFENNPLIIEGQRRGFIEIKGDRISYNLNQKKSYNWLDPEEWVRAESIAFLILVKNMCQGVYEQKSLYPEERQKIWQIL